MQRGYSQVIKYRVSYLTTQEWHNKKLRKPVKQSCDKLLVEFDMDSPYLTIHRSPEENYRLIAPKITEQDNDTLVSILYKSKDRDNRFCYVWASYRREEVPRKALFTIQYPDRNYNYYVEKED